MIPNKIWFSSSHLRKRIILFLHFFFINIIKRKLLNVIQLPYIFVLQGIIISNSTWLPWPKNKGYWIPQYSLDPHLNSNCLKHSLVHKRLMYILAISLTSLSLLSFTLPTFSLYWSLVNQIDRVNQYNENRSKQKDESMNKLTSSMLIA